MTTGTPFDPSATCPRWERFLEEILIREDGTPDKELIDYHHRALGYSCTGHTSEQKIFFKYGQGSNGKGVEDRAINHALGDYAANVGFSTFERYGRQSIPTDLARLPGKRFITASETNEGTRLNEARLKAISGGDIITARHLYGKEFEYTPSLKLWLSVNHLPEVKDDSYGFWRRVVVIPFSRQFRGDQIDRHLDETLRTEAAGILAWLVRGAVAYYERKLDPQPKLVQSATAAYETEADDLADFRAEVCTEDPNASIPAARLYKTYQDWAERCGIPVKQRISMTSFGRRMGARFMKKTTATGKVYHGIKVTG